MSKDASAASSEGGGKPGARNTLGRKEWSAEEDATIIAAVEEHGQKWRIIAAKLPGRSDDAVRNRWKRLSAEAANQASAVADALGFTGTLPEGALGDVNGVASAASGSAAPKAPPKPKAERLAWSKAEDAEIIRCVQAVGLKWGYMRPLAPLSLKQQQHARTHAHTRTLLTLSPSLLSLSLCRRRISQNLPGRTAHAIRNRFHRLQQLQAEQAAAAGNVLLTSPAGAHIDGVMREEVDEDSRVERRGTQPMCAVCAVYLRGVLMKMLREGWEGAVLLSACGRERGDLRGREKEGKRIIKEGSCRPHRWPTSRVTSS